MSESGTALYPLLFEPVYKDYLWGGDKIITQYERDQPPGVYAESWEVSVHPDGPSIVRNGHLAGRSLSELVDQWGSRLVGTRAGGDRFPLLIKILDARQCLSVQVHPNDETAARYGGEAKTEMWYLLQADAGAAVYAGLAKGVQEDGLVRAVKDESVDRLIRREVVKQGDAVYIPGGRVHAIDAGCMIYEVQQSSNTTYRIYDWGRLGPDGKSRDLHLEQANQVIDWDDTRGALVVSRQLDGGDWGERKLVCESPYFRMERLELAGRFDLPTDPGSFQVLFAASGTTGLSWEGGEELLPPGTSCLVPAELKGCSVAAGSDAAQCLRVTLPDQAS